MTPVCGFVRVRRRSPSVSRRHAQISATSTVCKGGAVCRYIVRTFSVYKLGDKERINAMYNLRIPCILVSGFIFTGAFEAGMVHWVGCRRVLEAHLKRKPVTVASSQKGLVTRLP